MNKGTGGGEVKRGTGVKEEEEKKGENICLVVFGWGGGGVFSMGNILNNYVSIDRDKELEII